MDKKVLLTVFVTAFLLSLNSTAAAEPASPKLDKRLVERGKYLAKTAGCNDCHTPGYAMNGGKVPESQWLVGDSLGWRGPWGTTYPINLRLYMRDMPEAKWVQAAKTMKSRPPMPWFALHDMTETDLKAIWHFVRSLGPAGEPAPIYLPPGVEPKGLYIQFPAAPK
jgi:mono/diheme cytochrome c family protein